MNVSAQSLGRIALLLTVFVFINGCGEEQPTAPTYTADQMSAAMNQSDAQALENDQQVQLAGVAAGGINAADLQTQTQAVDDYVEPVKVPEAPLPPRRPEPETDADALGSLPPQVYSPAELTAPAVGDSGITETMSLISQAADPGLAGGSPQAPVLAAPPAAPVVDSRPFIPIVNDRGERVGFVERDRPAPTFIGPDQTLVPADQLSPTDFTYNNFAILWQHEFGAPITNNPDLLPARPGTDDLRRRYIWDACAYMRGYGNSRGGYHFMTIDARDRVLTRFFERRPFETYRG